MAIRYKFVELTIVTDETIEAAVNAWVSKGWQLEGIRFVMIDGSRRPSMAFVSFVRDELETGPRRPRAITHEDDGDEPPE